MINVSLAEFCLVGGAVLFTISLFLFALSASGDKDMAFPFSVLLAMISIFLFMFGVGDINFKEGLGNPIPFKDLTENQVYMVVEKLPEKNFALIEGKIKGKDEERFTEIPIEYLNSLHKGDKFVKTGANIAIIPP